MKKFLSIVFCVALLLSICSVGFTASAEEYKVGDIIEFGNYPQSQVTDEAIIAELNKDTSEWISYGYYTDTGESDYLMKPSDCMSYKDVNYSGCKYRGVKIDSYRPMTTESVSSEENSCQSLNGYTVGNVYWFKYEPLRWRVLDPAAGIVMCDTIIDSQAFNNYFNVKSTYDEWGCYGDADFTHIANDYVNSSIRQWLNNEFYNTAFSDSQKSDIVSTKIDNSTANSEYYDVMLTEDNIFILSYDDSLNTGYGFSNSTENNSARQLKSTDYAKSQGVYVYGGGTSEIAYGYSDWLLRTPGDGSCYVYSADGGGCIGTEFCRSDSTSYGIVPAMTLQAIKSDTELNTEIITDIDNGNEGTTESGSDEINSAEGKNKTSGTSTESNKVLIICIVGGAVILILLILVIILLSKLKKGKNNDPDKGVSSISADPNPNGQNNFDDAQNYGQQYNQRNQNYYAQPQQMNNQAQPIQQNAQPQSPISVTALNQPGVCRKCGNQVTELYNISVNKDGQVRRAVLCRECTQNFVTAYNNRNK